MRPEAHLSAMRAQGRESACSGPGGLALSGPGSVSVSSREVSARPGEHLRPGVSPSLGSVLIPPLGRGREERGVAAKVPPGGEEFPESWGAAAAGATAHSPTRGAGSRGIAVHPPSAVSTRRPGERRSAAGCRVCSEATHFLYGHGITRSWRLLLPCVFYEFPRRVFSPCSGVGPRIFPAGPSFESAVCCSCRADVCHPLFVVPLV